mmetsp:Transcript_8540/g.24327  ORF Transcript_8540/g.24327 Transcript_8540/m.24327 type:complete len:207 (+) Transcript_8540:279-899(+)
MKGDDVGEDKVGRSEKLRAPSLISRSNPIDQSDRGGGRSYTPTAGGASGALGTRCEDVARGFTPGTIAWKRGLPRVSPLSSQACSSSSDADKGVLGAEADTPMSRRAVSKWTWVNSTRTPVGPRVPLGWVYSEGNTPRRPGRTRGRAGCSPSGPELADTRGERSVVLPPPFMLVLRAEERSEAARWTSGGSSQRVAAWKRRGSAKR